MVSNFQVEFGRDRNGVVTLQRVPVIYGDSSRQAATILKQNSENYLNSVPAMAVYISELRYDRDRVQNPTYVGKLNLRERSFDPVSGEYTTQQGTALSVERLMPVPYTLTLKLDIWTSNTDQKLQLIEQLVTLFNPALEIQSTDNYVDWTSLTYVLLESPSWTSRSVPMGTGDSIDIATLTFTLPIWISPPALVRKMGVIQKIIASIYDSSGDINQSLYDDTKLLSQQYFTPLQYGVILLDNQLSLVRYSQPTLNPMGTQVVKKVTANSSANVTLTLSSGKDIEVGMTVAGNGISSNCIVTSVNGNTVTTNEQITANLGDRISFTLVTSQEGEPVYDKWRDLINVYGNLINGTSQVKLELEDGNEVVGTVAYHPQNENLLIWNADIDTLPVNTLPAVSAIIDPQSSRPNNDLPALVAGTRYLLVSDYTTPAGAQPIYNWSGADDTPLAANANDIIEYNGQHWIVSFDSSQSTTVEYVTNLTTGIQYRWDRTAWAKSYEGLYRAGKWQLIL